MESHLYKFPGEDDEYWTSDGTKTGILHREDGPAVFILRDYVGWYYHGQVYPFHEWCQRTNKSPEDILVLKLKYKTY